MKKKMFRLYGPSKKTNISKGSRRYPPDIEKELKKEIELIYQERGRIDVPTIASRLAYSGKPTRTIEELLRQPYYRQGKINYDYKNRPKLAEWTQGLVIRNEDFKDIIVEFRDKGREILFILDPPYPKGSNRAYAEQDPNIYWKALKLLNEENKYILFINKPVEIPHTEVIERDKKLGGNKKGVSYSKEKMIYKI